MMEPMSWSMPKPPPAYVLSVRDEDGYEWERVDDAGLMWRRDLALQSWDWLIYNRGIITADEQAA